MGSEIPKTWKIPLSKHAEIKEAYDGEEWYWLISIWNEYELTPTRICSTCPTSVAKVKKYFADL